MRARAQNKVVKAAATLSARTLTELTNKRNSDSREAAKVHYSAKSLFVANLTRERSDQEAVFAYESSTRAERLYDFRERAKAEWVN
jgi:hypothetical protein